MIDNATHVLLLHYSFGRVNEFVSFVRVIATLRKALIYTALVPSNSMTSLDKQEIMSVSLSYDVKRNLFTFNTFKTARHF